MLSSQTKDETTFEAMKRLKAQTLTPARIKDLPVAELERLLHPVSFYKVRKHHESEKENNLFRYYFFLEQSQIPKANIRNTCRPVQRRHSE